MKRGKTFNQHLYASTLARIPSPRKRHFTSFESGLSAKPRRTFLIKTSSCFLNVHTYELGSLLTSHGDGSTSKWSLVVGGGGTRHTGARCTDCRHLAGDWKRSLSTDTEASAVLPAAHWQLLEKWLLFQKNSITSISCLTWLRVIKYTYNWFVKYGKLLHS